MPNNRNAHLTNRFGNEIWNHFDKDLFAGLLTEDIRFRGSLGQSAVGIMNLVNVYSQDHTAAAVRILHRIQRKSLRYAEDNPIT